LNFRKYEVMINENNPYFDFGRAVVAFEQDKQTEFTRYIFYVASYIYMGKLLESNSDDQSNSWFLKAPWCKMNNYMASSSERHNTSFTISEFFKIIFDRFHQKNPKLISILGTSLINLNYFDAKLRKEYARLIVNTVINEGYFKTAINLIQG